MKEMEARAIGNLLPDEDGLFSGVINEVEVDHVSLKNNNDDADDVLFYNGEGMEYENNGVNGGGFIYSTNPSRTLFVNYIENLVDSDLRALFEVNDIFNHACNFMNLDLNVCCLLFSCRDTVTFTCFIHLVNIMVLLSFATMILGQLSMS